MKDKATPQRDLRKRKKRARRNKEIDQIIRMLQNIDVWIEGITDRVRHLRSEDKDLPRQMKSGAPWQ